MRTLFYVGWLLGCLAACRQTDAPVPYQFDNTPGAGRFSAAVRRATEGVYGVSDGVSQFGDQVALKWSFLVNGTDTSYYLSAFSPLNAGIILLEPSPNRDSLSLTGYWRTLTNTNTGLARLALRVRRNGQLRAFAGSMSETDTLVLSGTFGDN